MARVSHVFSFFYRYSHQERLGHFTIFQNVNHPLNMRRTSPGRSVLPRAFSNLDHVQPLLLSHIWLLLAHAGSRNEVHFEVIDMGSHGWVSFLWLCNIEDVQGADQSSKYDQITHKNELTTISFIY